MLVICYHISFVSLTTRETWAYRPMRMHYNLIRWRLSETSYDDVIVDRQLSSTLKGIGRPNQGMRALCCRTCGMTAVVRRTSAQTGCVCVCVWYWPVLTASLVRRSARQYVNQSLLLSDRIISPAHRPVSGHLPFPWTSAPEIIIAVICLLARV